MNQPPSFEPRKRAKRPSSDGARPVGRPRNPDSSRSSNATPSSRAGQRPVRRSAFADGEARTSRPPEAQPPRHDHVDQSRYRQAERPAAVPPPAYAPRGHRPAASPEPALPPAEPRIPARPGKKRSVGRRILVAILCLLIAIIAWVFYLYSYGNGRLGHASALSGAPDTPGTTYLIVGSDERGEAVNDPTEGHRADTIMVLHKPESGAAALVSLPRDTLVHYPDSDANGKLNGAFSYGGAEYLVQTVEELTGLTVDRYIQIGMDGVKNLTDAVGGVELCLDYDVADEFSGLNWSAGCHTADGTTALAFSRMRYADPLGDIGRTERQRQVVAKIIDKALSPSTLLNPFAQRTLVGAVADVLTVDDDASLMNVGFAGLALRDTIGPDGLKGAPPIASLNHPGPGGSSTVLLADEAEQFWADLRDGTLTPESFASF